MSIFNFVATSGTQSRNRKRKHPCHRGFLYKRKQKRRVIKKKGRKKNFYLLRHGVQERHPFACNIGTKTKMVSLFTRKKA